MKNLILCTLGFFLCTYALLLSQETAPAEAQSVHLMHKLQYGLEQQQTQATGESSNEYSDRYCDGLTPLRTENSSGNTVFGYLPYWEYKTARPYLRYKLLSHIAVFDFQCDAQGNIKNPAYWPWTDVIDSAHSNGVRVIMTASLFDAADIHSLLTNPDARKRFIENVKTKFWAYRLDGINVDFEGLKKEDRGAAINAFMQQLSDSLHSNFPGSEVSFAGPAVNWGGWDLSGLASSCDYIFIMGYGFYGSWNTTSGPNAPLSGLNYCIENSITRTDKGYGTVLARSPEKLILGVPYYGNHWITKTAEAFSDTVKYLGSTNFRDDILNAGKYSRIWENPLFVPWYRYQLDGKWHQVWYDDQQSLALKYSFADSKKLRGIGIWALGKDRSRNELWDLLEQRAVTSAAQPEKLSTLRPEEPRLLQNYPNPFNPSTVIRFSMSTEGNADLRVYDLLGREIIRLLDKWLEPGEYSVRFDASNLPAGTYFCRFRTGEYSSVRKMVMVK